MTSVHRHGHYTSSMFTCQLMCEQHIISFSTIFLGCNNACEMNVKLNNYLSSIFLLSAPLTFNDLAINLIIVNVKKLSGHKYVEWQNKKMKIHILFFLLLARKNPSVRFNCGIPWCQKDNLLSLPKSSLSCSYLRTFGFALYKTWMHMA